jgi:hypothetical protein
LHISKECDSRFLVFPETRTVLVALVAESSCYPVSLRCVIETCFFVWICKTCPVRDETLIAVEPVGLDFSSSFFLPN